MDEVFRQEKKYVLTLEEYYKCRHDMERILHKDSHSGRDGYWIRSLYFDSVDDRDFREKEAGIELRRKIRLRIYDPHAQTAKLEIKKKEGVWQKKTSLLLFRPEAEELIRGNYSVLLSHKEAAAAQCYAMLNEYCYRPKTIVTYRRLAFSAKENAVRITFDDHITVNASDWKLFDAGMGERYGMDVYYVVLEVKYNGFLPQYIKDILKPYEINELSVSKYCMGRKRG